MPISNTARKAKQDAILTALRQGSTRTAAAESTGIDRTTLWRWLNSNATFCNAVACAEAQAQRFYEDAVYKAVEGYDVVEEKVQETKDGTFTTTVTKREWDPDIAKWWLERRRRAEYGPEINLRTLSTEQLLALLPPGATDGPLPTMKSLSAMTDEELAEYEREEAVIDAEFLSRE